MSDDATSPAAVGRQLARRRANLDLTQDQLAMAVGVRSRSISAIERGSNAIQRSKRSAWEKALRLKPGTISRAYEDGSPLEPADISLTDSAHAQDDITVEREPTLAEMTQMLEDRIRWFEEDNERKRKADEERIKRLEEEVRRLGGQSS